MYSIIKKNGLAAVNELASKLDFFAKECIRNCEVKSISFFGGTAEKILIANEIVKKI